MTDFSQTRAVAGDALNAQSRRLRIIAENIANADTPGFRRKFLTFSVDNADGGVRVGRVQLDQSELPQIYDPAHPMADADGYHEASSVRLMVELADAREAQRSYEANLRVFDQTRQMSGALLDLIRR